MKNLVTTKARLSYVNDQCKEFEFSLAHLEANSNLLCPIHYVCFHEVPDHLGSLERGGECV